MGAHFAIFFLKQEQDYHTRSDAIIPPPKRSQPLARKTFSNPTPCLPFSSDSLSLPYSSEIARGRDDGSRALQERREHEELAPPLPSSLVPPIPLPPPTRILRILDSIPSFPGVMDRAGNDLAGPSHGRTYRPDRQAGEFSGNYNLRLSLSLFPPSIPTLSPFS